MMKHILIFLFLAIFITGFAQKHNFYAIEASYQFYDEQSIYLGINHHKFDAFKLFQKPIIMSPSLYVETYTNDPSLNNVYAIGYRVDFGFNFLRIGYNARFLFQGKSTRSDLGPLLKLGYRYVWVEYSIHFKMGDNFFADQDRAKIPLSNENNIKLVVTIPIIYRK